MIQLSSFLVESMCEQIKQFIVEQPDDPIFEAYDYPAKEFTVFTIGTQIVFIHPLLPALFLGT